MVDRKLDVRLRKISAISLIRERPRCYAYLCTEAIQGPMMIDEISIDLSDADWYHGKVALTLALEIASGNPATTRTLMTFDPPFFNEFSRVLLRASAETEILYIATRSNGQLRMREYITHADTFHIGTGEQVAQTGDYASPEWIEINPRATCMLISGTWRKRGNVQSPMPLFHLPRSESFFRTFSEMVCKAIRLLDEASAEMARTDSQPAKPQKHGELPKSI